MKDAAEVVRHSLTLPVYGMAPEAGLPKGWKQGTVQAAPVEAVVTARGERRGSGA